MVKVNWTSQAIEDIHGMREYFRSQSAKYAEQFTDKIFEEAANLEHYPQIGRIVPELERPEIRELIYKNYRIVYHVVSNERIDIVAVHNGSRPLTKESVFE